MWYTRYCVLKYTTIIGTVKPKQGADRVTEVLVSPVHDIHVADVCMYTSSTGRWQTHERKFFALTVSVEYPTAFNNRQLEC